MNKFKPNFYKRKFLTLFLIFSFFIGLAVYPSGVGAAGVVTDPGAVAQRTAIETKKTVVGKVLEQLGKAGSKAFFSATQTVLNKLAFDAATWVGSGGAGQTPLFVDDYWSDFGNKAADTFVSNAIQNLSKEWAVDLCRPNFSVQASIGLGLVQFNDPGFGRIDCGWQELSQNWTNEYEKWKSISSDPAGFLKKVGTMFNPSSNDIGTALTLFTRIDEEAGEEKKKKEDQLKANQGWLDVRNIGGKATTPPGQGQRELQKVDATQVQSLGKFTGNAFLDAANVFLNQVAITAFNKYIREGGLVDMLSRGSADDYSGSNHSSPDADPRSFSNQTYMVDSLKKVIKPRFDVKADFNVLSDLVICLDSDNPMPNNCVIDNEFSQAVQNRYTVIGAIEDGFINPNWVFDRNIDYRSGFNYRSLMILRKFRIVPLGWEEALLRSEQQTAVKGFRYTLMDMISCFDPNDEYETFSDGFMKSNFSSHAWCEGLIDPIWVLKAPLNYCKRQGYGGFLTSKQLIEIPDSVSSSQTGIDVKPIIVSRADDYCADEQSCIKERFDGTCENYGYCVEEKRTWNFGQDSCDPVYNTCDAFISASTGKKLALLKNTIDYGSCDSDNVGCARYSTSGSYSISNKQVSWSSFDSIYFNGRVETCSSNNEGCQEFIRMGAGSGHNFLLNGDFENDLSIGGWESLNTSSTAYSGNASILLSGTGEMISKNNIKVASDNHTIAGESYTLSFYSLCNTTSTMSIGSKIKNILPSTDFVYQAMSHTFPSNYSSNLVSFFIKAEDSTSNSNIECYIDNLKLERGVSGTYYSNYRDNGLTYQKVIPDYLKNTCYVNPLAANPDFRLKDNAPSECFNYARLCNFSEIGCNLFTSIYGIQTSAKALEKDYCPEQCVGYDVYVQSDTLFEGKSVEKIIPSTATACSASNTGCTEFTNLDEVAAGGEGREYYVSLKHCIKPAQGTCHNFYSWEGNNESGYQLRSFSLEKDGSASIPKVTKGNLVSSSSGVYKHQIGGSNVCDQAIYNSPVSSPNYNPDCREFYNQAGDIIYILYPTSITCSENCKPYRMTEKNIDATITTQATCLGSDKKWDDGVCYSCLAGGEWDTTQEACVYQAIPGEGKTCPASANGCREYNGNSGNNIRIVSAYDFNDGLGDWAGATPSTESINQGGKSMALDDNDQGEVLVGGLVSEGSSYVIKFSAKSNQAVNLSIGFGNGSNQSSFFGVTGEGPVSAFDISITVPASNEWQNYQVSLDRLDHEVDAGEKLYFAQHSSSGLNPVVYISNIVLLEVTDRYYLLKNSWNTPNICYYDTMNNYRGVNYNLGCQPYTDLTNLSHNLRQFSSLCSDSAVGCQMAIQTNNYSSPNSAEIKSDNYVAAGNVGGNVVIAQPLDCEDDPDCVFVPADKFVAVVLDSSKTCSSANMGCSRLGKVISNNPYAVDQNIYQDVYLKNNPNNYNNTLCSNGDVGCDSWSSSAGSGTMYFKDPGDNLCQWRKGADVNSNFAWYKKAVKKCKASSGAFTSNICSSASDCVSGQTCELDNGDYLCPVDSMKTIGYGGGSPTYQPAEEFGINWTGLCPLKDAGCTEYIDPLSSFSSNLVLNPNFSDLDGDGKGFDLWMPSISSPDYNCGIIPSQPNAGAQCPIGVVPLIVKVEFYQENIGILPNKLYALQTNGDQEATLSCDNNIFKLESSSNNFSSATTTIKVVPNSPKALFYSGNNNGSCQVNYFKQVLIMSGGENEPPDLSASPENVSIEVKEAAIDYQFKQNLDFSSCNSQADFNSGCILFNERSYLGQSGLPALNYNSLDYSNYSNCLIRNNCFPDSNSLIKVNPDRVCGKWLACYAYNYNPYTEEKTCLEMGECTAFNYDGSCFNFSKASEGARSYLPGRDLNASGYSVLGINYLSSLKQVGEDVIEFTFESGSDLGSWTMGNSDTNPLIEKCLINKANSIGIKNSNVTYPASGFNFIKIGSSDCSVGPNYYWLSNTILGDFSQGSKYYFSALVNTSDLNFNEKAKIDIVDSANTNNSAGDIEIGRKNDWQEVSFEFTYGASWNSGLKIILGVKNQDDSWTSAPVYFDDIRIEPVLEARSDKFIPATCRLYPTQESLMCESENRNFISSGWYGYCLQKDPSNSDVCLLWYPLDSVKGDKGAGASFSSFTGYPDTGSKPYYCAEMSADFKMLEYNKGYLRHSATQGDTTYDPGYIVTLQLTGNDCPSNYAEVIVMANTPDNNDGIKSIKDSYCIPYSEKFSLSNAMYFPCKSTTNTGSPCANFKATSFPEYAMGKERFYPESLNTTLPTITRNQSFYNDNPDWQFIKGSSVNGGANGYEFFLLINNRGWYEYDGFHTYLDYKEKDYGVKIWDYNEDSSSKFKEINEYTPVCSKIVQGEIPWAQRLKSSNYSVGAHKYYADYPDNSPNAQSPTSPEMNLPLHYYNLSTPGAPFGAIVNSGSPLASSSKVFAGIGSAALAASGKYYGLPYSCDDNNQTVYLGASVSTSSCAFLYFDNGVKVFNPANMTHADIDDRDYLEMRESDFYFKDYLKHLFLKTVNIKGDPTSEYNFTAGTSNAILSKVGPRDYETDYKAVRPSIATTTPNEVRLTNAIGVPVNKSGDIYEVESAGFYTLSFNTIVDLEQVPLSEIIVRMKKSDTSWTANEGFVRLSNIDPVPPESGGAHKVFRYLTPGNYNILIKAKDNWGFYNCVGLSGFVGAVANTPCGDCCITREFKDPSPQNDPCNNCAN